MPLEHAPTLDHLVRTLNDDREREVRRHLRIAHARRAAAARRRGGPARWLLLTLGRLRTTPLTTGRHGQGERLLRRRIPDKQRTTRASLLGGAADPHGSPAQPSQVHRSQVHRSQVHRSQVHHSQVHRSQAHRSDARRTACAACA